MRNIFVRGLLLSGFSFLFVISAAFAEIPSTINFQGKLTDLAGVPSDGAHSVLFTVWDSSTGGTQLWSETQTITVSSGIYNVPLGASVPISTAIFSGSSAWLQIKVGSDSAMTPRIRFSAVPFAVKASLADSLLSGLPVDNLFADLRMVRTSVGPSSYIVPVGKNFVLVSAKGGDCAESVEYSPGNFYSLGINCLIPVTGSHNATSVMGYETSNPAVLSAGDILNSTSSAITIRLKGFLVPQNVEVVLQDLGIGSSYTVPASKKFYYQVIKSIKECSGSLNIDGFVETFSHSDAGIMESGQSITNNTVCALTLNGYLR